MTDSKAATSLTKARARMLLGQPFFGQLSLRLRLVESPEISTLATDGRVIMYNPDFVARLSHNQVMTAVAHEVGHCIFDHVGRRGSREPDRWGIAVDHVVNLMLEEAKFEPISGYWNADNRFAGMSAEKIYTLLPPRPTGPKALCVVMDGPPGQGTEAEHTATRNEWQVAVMQAANTAKNAGKLPASLQRFVTEMVTPKVDWRTQLRQLMTGFSGKDDYSFMRPNRRMAGQGIFLPSLFSESMGPIVVVTDDSGSIQGSELNAFAAEISAIRDAVNPERTLHISCDAAINHTAEFFPGDDFKLVSKGGGGTDFRPPFQHVATEGMTPAVLVYLTDMYGPFPKDPPGYPVIWCATSKKIGPFGHTIHLEV